MRTSFYTNQKDLVKMLSIYLLTLRISKELETVVWDLPINLRKISEIISNRRANYWRRTAALRLFQDLYEEYSSVLGTTITDNLNTFLKDLSNNYLRTEVSWHSLNAEILTKILQRDSEIFDKWDRTKYVYR